MSAGLSSAAKSELYTPNTAGVWLALVTIEHADLPAAIRVVNDRQDVTSGGDLYTALAFSVRLPADRDEPPHAVLVLDNVDRSLISSIRAITTPASITVELIRRSAPDTILRTFPNLRVVGSRITATTIELQLSANPVVDEGYPGDTFSPLAFPAGFDR